MTQVDTTAILSFLFQQMEALSKGEIDTNKANAQANLAKQACNVLNYELKRTEVQMKMFKIGGDIKADQIELREIETKRLEQPLRENQNPILEESVYDFLERNKLKFSNLTRQATMFRNLGIKTVKDLVCMDGRRTLRVRGYGLISLEELKTVMQDNGLYFGMNT